MIKIIDYGLGNIQAIANVYRRLFIPFSIAKNSSDFVGATKLILPGVGAFDYAIQRLIESGMKGKVCELVEKSRVPVLGICVGMQMLAESSDEGEFSGLGWIPGRVRSFSSAEKSSNLPQPHMGWNDVLANPVCGLFKGMDEEMRFYFLHSYFFECQNPENIAATSRYGFGFSCAVFRDNVYGVQFHPEKSHHFGAALLKNFAEL